jgi:uncharacterized membrane protein
MNDILMTNLFFFITATSSILITIILIILLVYVIKFIKKINRITSVVEQETVKIMNDVEEARSVVKQHIGLVRGVASATVIKKIIEKIFNKNKI